MGKLIDSVPGQYSKIQLEDGAMIFISVEGGSMRVAQLNFLGLPTKTIGRVSSCLKLVPTPNGILTEGESQEALTERISKCSSVDEVKTAISQAVQRDGSSHKPPEDEMEKIYALQFIEALKILRLAMFERLKEEYCRRYPTEIAANLAAAISNELFFEEPHPQHDHLYNQGLVQKEIKALGKYGDMKEVYTNAVRTHISMQYSQNKITAEEMTSKFEKCSSFGIYGQFPVDANTDIVELIKKFCCKVKIDFDAMFYDAMEKVKKELLRRMGG